MSDLYVGDDTVGNAVREWSRYGNQVLSVATRSDGFVFLLVKSGPRMIRVKAGCRDFTIEQYRKHTRTYARNNHKRYGYPPGFAAAKKKETLAILALFELQLKKGL